MSNVVFLTLLCFMLVVTKCAVSLPLWVIELGKQTSCLLWLSFQAWKSGCAVVVLPWSHWQVVNGLFPTTRAAMKPQHQELKIELKIAA